MSVLLHSFMRSSCETTVPNGNVTCGREQHLLLQGSATEVGSSGVLVVGAHHVLRSIRSAGVEAMHADIDDFYSYLVHGHALPGQRKILSMQPALDYAVPLLRQIILKSRPRLLMVHSKGVSIACELARLELWRGNTLISSPIINPSDALGEDDYAGMAALLNGSSSISFAIGTEERDLIMDSGLEEVSGQYPWPVYMFHGGHSWHSDARNSLRIARILSGLATA